jgi:hypothetical protein
MLYRFVATFLVLGSTFAQAEVPYIDNRSSAADLVSSLYNAINRREYARAWSYFSEPPAKSFEDFAKGFDGTQSVRLEIGAIAAEGAAGSSYYTVPVAIRSTETNGEERVFAGCYTLRQVSATIQDPPFQPLVIEKGKLKVSTDGALPDCGGGAANQAELDKAQAIQLFRASFSGECDAASPTREEPLEPEVYPIAFRYDYQTATDPEQQVTVYQFPCSLYAYNYSNVYFIKRLNTPTELISFAQPSVNSQVEGEENQVLKAMSIDGFVAQSVLINSEFDVQSQSITFFAKGRGIGDLSSSGTYKFREGTFVLTDYAYDATGNGEIDPVELVVGGKVVEPKF